MKSKPVGWFEIYVQDIQRAKAFYEGVFSTELQQLNSPEPDLEMWAFPGAMDQGHGASGAIVKMKDGPSGGMGAIVYFMCDDCGVEAGRAASHGGKVMKPKFSIGEYGFAALVHDTDGNVIGLHSMR